MLALPYPASGHIFGMLRQKIFASKTHALVNLGKTKSKEGET